MSLNRIKPPMDDTQVLDELQPFLRPGDPSLKANGQQRYWQKLFDLPLEKLLVAQSITAAGTPKGWRYLFGNPSGNALSATINTANPPKVIGLSRGTGVNKNLHAARELRTLPEAAANNYDVWVMTIPGLYTEAFWLQSTTGKADLVIPFLTAQEFRLGYAYTADAFLQIARGLADVQLKSDHTAPRDTGPSIKKNHPKAQPPATPKPHGRKEPNTAADLKMLEIEERRQKQLQRDLDQRKKHLEAAKAHLLPKKDGKR